MKFNKIILSTILISSGICMQVGAQEMNAKKVRTDEVNFDIKKKINVILSYLKWPFAKSAREALLNSTYEKYRIELNILGYQLSDLLCVEALYEYSAMVKTKKGQLIVLRNSNNLRLGKFEFNIQGKMVYKDNIEGGTWLIKYNDNLYYPLNINKYEGIKDSGLTLNFRLIISCEENLDMLKPYGYKPVYILDVK